MEKSGVSAHLPIFSLCTLEEEVLILSNHCITNRSNYFDYEDHLKVFREKNIHQTVTTNFELSDDPTLQVQGKMCQ